MCKIIFLQKLPDTICVRKGEKPAFSCTLSVLATKNFGPKQCKPGNTIKIVFQRKLPKTKNDTFFLEKGVFLTWVKKWVLLIAFLKGCVFCF